MKRVVLALVLTLFAAPTFAAEPAAIIGFQEGTVLVNQGDVFETAADVQELQPGDRIMVMEGGNVELVFADGCQLPLESGSLFLVPAQSTCASGTVADVQRIGPSYAQVVDTKSEEWDATEWAILGGTIIVLAGLYAHNTSSSP